MKTILTCVILLSILALAALYGGTNAKAGATTDYFQRVANGR